MAKTGVVEIDSTVKMTTEMKKELQRLVKAIVEGSDCRDETFDLTVQTLLDLKKSVIKRSLSVQMEPNECPDDFLCPISRQIMKDPVVVSTGQTYDRSSIQGRLDSGDRICPLTKQVISDMNLIQNNLIRNMIARWCKKEKTELQSPSRRIHEDAIDKVYFEQLMERLSSVSATDRNMAAKEVRQLTKQKTSYRALFGDQPESISMLLKPLSQDKTKWDSEVREDLVTTIMNISISEDNKKKVGETPGVIPLLVESMKSGCIATKSNAAAALFTLSALDSNKVIIGNSGAFEGLVALIEEGNQSAIKDAASAFFNLCILHENRGNAVNAGAVKVLLGKIDERVCVDELVTILALLANHQRAVDELGYLGAVSSMLSLIRDENICPRSKENCIAVLYSIALNDRTKWKEIREEESTNHTISLLVKNGTSRAQRKAAGLLERVNRGAAGNFTHTA
ncbi:hypothetical protein Syun_006131 [Stephania yunnanensis]|uniref:RING-type E3 ubiquitin transferase n=1 Tax=Stephania yunnanensis TaxID=152371 RepID=A0AAP0PY99_9MAGN